MKTINKWIFPTGAVALLILLAAALLINRSDPNPIPEPHTKRTKVPLAPPSSDPEIEPEQAIRDLVQLLAGTQGDGSISTRRKALETLPVDLSASEYRHILEYVLLAEQPDEVYYRAWHAFFNDTLNALIIDQTVPLTVLPADLAVILNDEGRHRVIRDYALQHLLAFAEYRSGDEERLRLLEEVWQALDSTRDSFRGTYLVAVSYRAGESGWPSKEAVARQALAVASADEAHVLSRISALQVCGKLGREEALSLAQEIAGDTGAHMTLRTSAIATIGDLGTKIEQGFLTELAGRSPRRLQIAISAAIERIKAKGSQV